MVDIRVVIILLGYVSVHTMAAEENNCTCSYTNSRCDEGGVCRCDPGWDGESCERCVTTPGCLHGSCQQPWQCSCHEGWGGRFCDKDLSACFRRPCLNGATCILEDSGDFSCLCAHGFHGDTCQRRAGPCSRSRSPCRNGGQCEDADGFSEKLTCRCLAGFSGPRCESDVDDCLMTPCANGATCLDGVNRFTCVCPSGFRGRFCTVNVDDCASRPCLNAGRCLDLAGRFRCICRPGFTGDTCQTTLREGELFARTSLGHNITTPGCGRNSSTTISSDGWGSSLATLPTGEEHLLKVTVSERGAHVSELQLVALLVFAAMTLCAVTLTATIILHGRCRRCGHAYLWRQESPESFVKKQKFSDL